MFTEEIVQPVFYLRGMYKGKKNCVVMTYPIIEITKFFLHREVSIKLYYYQSTNTFEIQPPDQKFYNKISYYDFSQTERRWIRNKRYLFEIIKDLKTCGLWGMISNKDFMVINPNYEISTEDSRAEVLKKLIKA